MLDAVLATTDAAATALAATAESGDADAAHAVRRQLDGCAQALERIAATPVVESLDRARSALEHAVDELTWSARLVEAPGVRAGRRRCGLPRWRSARREPRTLAQARSAIEVSARSLKKSTVLSMPLSNGIAGSQPSCARASAVSRHERRCSPGFPGACSASAVVSHDGCEHSIDRVDVGLDAGADVVDAGRPVDRGEVRAHDVMHMHVVARLLPVAVDHRSAARDETHGEDGDDARLTMRILPRTVHVGVAQGDELQRRPDG